MYRVAAGIFLASAFFPISGIAKKLPEKELAFFESKVRPLLLDNCYKCHSIQSGKSKGGLLLDSKTGWQQGGDSGPAILPGDTQNSLLLKVIRHEVQDTEMPPDKKLSQQQIRILEQWVQQGAIDPR